MYSIQYFSLYLIAILYIISIKVKTNDFHEFSALSRLETAVEPKPQLVCDRLGTEPAEYGNSRGCHNRLAVSRVTATLIRGHWNQIFEGGQWKLGGSHDPVRCNPELKPQLG
jgi:hypothetical protein